MFDCLCQRRRKKLIGIIDNDKSAIQVAGDVYRTGETSASVFDESHELDKEDLSLSTPACKNSVETLDIRTTPGDFGNDSSPLSECVLGIGDSGIGELSFIKELQDESLEYLDDSEYLGKQIEIVSVPFFSPCTSTMGYTRSRLLHIRMQGILAIPDRRRFVG